MMLDIVIVPSLLALLAGIAILIWLRVLNYIVAIYLVLIGLVGLWVNMVAWGLFSALSGCGQSCCSSTSRRRR
jgi:hypothetical protein